MTTKHQQNCGCVINVYSDGSAGGAEIGEWCDLHGAASDLLKACVFAFSVQKNSHGIFDTSDRLNAEKLEAAIAKAQGEQS